MSGAGRPPDGLILPPAPPCGRVSCEDGDAEGLWEAEEADQREAGLEEQMLAQEP